MADDLLDYYNRELTYVRRLAARFAEAHPKIAGRLRLNTDDSSDDPHVERLIEAFAYLTARLRSKIDDEFPEITASLLGVLYPHYQAPIPSMAVVQFRLDPEQTQITAGHTLPRGTELESEPVHGESCRFRTCYPTTLWPVEVAQAGLTQAPFPAPPTSFSAEATSVLRISLVCNGDETTFGDLGPASLRFFLKGQPHNVHRLYELIFNHAIGVALARDPKDPGPSELGPECLGLVGFEADEGMLPYPARSFVGYRLLTEYFAFPQKFLFFDLSLAAAKGLPALGRTAEIYVFLNRSLPDLARNVSADTFQLGCTPVVNLYKQRAEPIALDHTDFEYQVVPDRRRPLAHEVYSVDRVVASPPKGESAEFLPFFSIKHAIARGGARTYWHSSRRPVEDGVSGDRGTEVFLALVDLGFRPSAPVGWTVEVETTCLNRDLPQELPFGAGGNQARLQLLEGGGLASRIHFVTPPTRALRPAAREGLLWGLLSHLSLNHMSLAEDGKAEALREILTLYDFSDSPDTRNQIDGILGIRSRPAVAGVRTEGPVTYCRGTEITVQFDEERFTVSGLFLFANVLERFFALYTTVNSFTRFTATVKGREGALRRWPPRVGQKTLV